MALKKNFNGCIFCLDSQYKNPSISLHSFPRDQSRRYLWLTACGLTEEDYKPSRKLCSQHFEKDCYKTGTNLRILKRNSVPTKLNKRTIEFFKSTRSHKVPEMSSHEGPKPPTYQIDKQAVTTVKLETISNCEMKTSQIDDSLKQNPHKHEGDVTKSNLASARKAIHNITKAKYVVIEQRKKIKHLHLKVSRLRKRLSSKTELLNHLKKKKCVCCGHSGNAKTSKKELLR